MKATKVCVTRNLICIGTACVILLFNACSNVGVENSPEGVVKEYFSLVAKNKPEKVVELYSDYFFKELTIDKGKFLENRKKHSEELKFKDYKLIDLRFTGKDDLGDGMVLVSYEEKYSYSTEKENKIGRGNFVVINENGKWKLNGDFIRKKDYSNKCGTASPITICINRALIFIDHSRLEGTIENNSSYRYSFGFSRPAQFELTTDKAETAHGSSLTWGRTIISQNFKGNIAFAFGSELEPQLVKGVPEKVTIKGLLKLGWSDLPASIRDKGMAVGVVLK